ncbi:DUF4097 family beta strand repeat-containing protein [Cohnella soli]|uniref:DUF4097 domain-containing protein n=1 Tax=Cohnella soli TaxID=425005 RepID=A0ABW0HRG4_9BACL
MKKFWFFTAFCLIVVGAAGALTYDWKSNGKKLTEFEKEWTFSASDLRKLDITSDYNVSVKFVKSEDGRNTIKLNGKGTEKMIENTKSTSIVDKSLKLNLTRMPKRYIQIFDLTFHREKEELIVALSDDAMLDSLRIKLDSGNITVDDASLVRLGEANLSADSGNIKLNRYKSERLIVDVDSGNITGDGVSANTTASADSGNIKFENMSGPTHFSVDSGNIKLYKLDTASADLKADSGNVYVEVPAEFAGAYDLRANAGSVRSPDSKNETTDYIKARTDSGNIRVEQR